MDLLKLRKILISLNLKLMRNWFKMTRNKVNKLVESKVKESQNIKIKEKTKK